METKQEGRLVPRTEAQPFAWEKLTAAQKAVVRRACELIGAVAEGPDKEDEERTADADARKPEWPFLPRIDVRRRSHALLIDGGRGSGKSSALLTLLQAMVERLREPTRQLQQDLARLPLGVVPLPILDLEAVPRDANLLLHLVGGFHPLVVHVTERARGAAPWLSDKAPRPVKEAWAHFLHAAALSRDGALTGRREKLDPEAFALELQESLLQLQDLGKAFRTLIDELVKASAETLQVQRPVFVVPIDDGDMNDAQAVPLLRLLRELHHERVVYVVTGDSNRFELALREDFRRLYAEVRKGDRPNLQHEYGLLESEHVEQALSKVFPPEQRVDLPLLPPWERLDRLQDRLARVRAPSHPVRLAHFAAYLRLVRQGQRLLPDRLRDLISLGQWLDLQPRTGEHLDAARFFVKLTQLGEAADPAEALAEQVRKLADARWRLTDTRVFRARDDVAVEIPASPVLFRERSRERPAIEPSWSPPIDPSAAFAGAVDCLGPDEEPTPSTPPFFRTKREDTSYPWPLPDWRSPLDHFALWEVLKAALRFDDADDQEERRRLGGDPRHQKPRSPDSPFQEDGTVRDIDSLVRVYLLAVQAYVDWRERQTVPWATLLDQVARLADEAHGWPEVVHRLVERTPWDPKEGEPPSAAWRHSAAVIACPELAPDERVSRMLLDALHAAFKGTPSNWEAVKRHLRAVRERLVKLADPSGGSPIDTSESANVHPWDELISEQSAELRKRSAVWQDLVQRLRSLPAPQVEPRQALGVELSALRYLSATRRPWLEREAPIEPLHRWLKVLAELGRSEGETRLALRELWRITKEEVAHEMPDVPEALEPQQLLEMYAELQRQGSTWRQLPTNDPLSLGRVKAARGAFRWSEGRGLRHPMGRIVFEMCWDFAVDAADAWEMPEAPSDKDLRWWRVGGELGRRRAPTRGPRQTGGPSSITRSWAARGTKRSSGSQSSPRTSRWRHWGTRSPSRT